MTLYNAASRARNATSLVNQNSGGGNKKMGLYPQVGRDSWTSVAYGNKPGCCFSLGRSRTARYPAVCAVSRPIGSTTLVGWKC
jgi:hypothetical protein